MFKKTSHLSDIIEASQKEPVIIFKFSSECNSSARLKEQFEKEAEKEVEEKRLIAPIHIVIVQTQPALSKNIADMFEITHESPQIIILNKGKVTHTAHHHDIKIENFKFQ